MLSHDPFAVYVIAVCGLLLWGALVALLVQKWHRAHAAAQMPDTPTPADLTALGYDPALSRRALAFLLAEKAAGRMNYYRKPIHSEGWYVTIEALSTSASPSEYRRELGAWMHDWVTGQAPLDDALPPEDPRERESLEEARRVMGEMWRLHVELGPEAARPKIGRLAAEYVAKYPKGGAA